jgi:integrase
MEILAECPHCHKKWATTKKKFTCYTDLDRAKQRGRARYWVTYRDENGRQKRKSLSKLGLDPFSITDAKDAEARYRLDKRENKPIFNERPQHTFSQLADWYLSLESVKRLRSFDIIKIKIEFFNKEFGDRIVDSIKPEDLRNYQIKRKNEGKAPGTIDQEISKGRAMIARAVDNDMVSHDAVRVFDKVKRTLRKGQDVRDRILSPSEFKALIKHAKGHTKDIIAMGYFTGMRKGEILGLTWDKVDLQKRVIKLEAEDTKDREKRNIPICNELHGMLYAMPNRIRTIRKNNHVFLYRGKPVSDIRKGIRDACSKAGITYGRFKRNGFIIHDLRHSFNTNMRKAGIAESIIMKITGHSTHEMFERYNTVDNQDMQKAVDQFETYLSNVDQTVDQDHESKSIPDLKSPSTNEK